MKQFISSMLLVGMCVLFACDKQKDNTFEKMDEATFIKTLSGEIVRFSEDEDFSFSKNLASQIGFSSITISKGIYEIFTSSSDFGTVTFNVKNYSLVNEAQSPLVKNEATLAEDDGIGIRIAKVKKRRCNGEYVTCTCCCGIGFNCGTTGFDDDEEEIEDVLSIEENPSDLGFSNNPRIKKAKISFNESDKTLTLHFIEKVDWKSLN